MSVPVRNEVAVAAINAPPSATAIESLLIKGDLSKLNEQQRTEYYMRLCHSIGLNPMTQPFQYLTLNGKLVLYARRDCADQLRKINGISIEIVSQDKADGLLSIHVRAKDRDGRQDEDLGVVSFPENLKGEAAANTILKAVTKAKRRVTLSLSGLGFLDETEVADIPRQNPHVTRPEDILPEVEYDENGSPIDNSPKGDERIERLPKAKARPDFAAAQFELRRCQSPEALKAWGDANANRIESYPVDWQEMLRGIYTEHMQDLRAAQRGGVPTDSLMGG
jgi:hypothetical protein